MKLVRPLLLVAVIAALALTSALALEPNEKARRDKAAQLMRDGNWKEAYDIYADLATDPKGDAMQAPVDLSNAVQCLNQLGRIGEFDAFVEKAVAAHENNWQLLRGAAQQYMSVNHQGVVVAGEFVRGPHRGGHAKWVNVFERDRVRALQILEQALALVGNDAGAKAAVADSLANTLLANRGYGEAWRLQYLTDLATLPDHEEGYYRGYYGGSRGAPVDEDGAPVFHALPESRQAAATDGERWRWALQYDAARTRNTRRRFAEFLHAQFGVQTMASQPWFGRGRDDAREDESGTYALHTLKETETIARLASGVKRFDLPDEFNFLRIYTEIAAERNASAMDALAQIFENRRQYDKAADWWRQSIAIDPRDWRQDRLAQIVGNWGLFEPAPTQPAGEPATVQFRFRNGKGVRFVAWEIDVEKLLADVKAYLNAHPGRLDWEQMNLANLGYRLVRKNQHQYRGAQAAEWRLDLEPRPNHFDKRTTVETPLEKAGAYLLSAVMDDGNTSNIIVWVADTVIVQKPMEQKSWYFVADAVTGEPVADANLEFFGYRQEWVNDPATRGGRHIVHTTNFAERTDAEGQVVTARPETRFQWVIVARTPEGRLAYLGFTGIWYGRQHDREYNQRKTFVITDRPVYRPGQTVKFKFWINNAKYDQEGHSPFAGQTFTVKGMNPRNEEMFEKAYTTDEYGGLNGELVLDAEATLGMYRVYIDGVGGGSFRVEEYKKPEFEVTVKAPDEPVALGETIVARIEAKYYFGAPVTQATVKYRIMRTSFNADWRPIEPWDWLYGSGYGWFGYDYEWYPGWRRWGFKAPRRQWWGWRPQPQPEMVAETEAPIGADGTLEVKIDTAIAKEMMGDTDHRYEITVEVTDQSRRTIIGQGAVLATREPFKVYAWVDRGHYRVGDTVRASFQARTPDGKPVTAPGVLKLLKIAYDERRRPVETPAQTWEIDTNEEGVAAQQIKAAQPGQYRLSYTVTDAKGRSIEGGYVFVIVGEGADGADFRFNAVELVPDRKEYQPGDTIDLMVNADRENAVVVLFTRPTNGVYQPPRMLRLDGRSAMEQIAVVKRDMPNLFVEALTVSGGRVHETVREIAVPPESRVLDITVAPTKTEYKPGEEAAVKLTLTGPDGKPFVGSAVVSMYDKAVEYISGGSNVAEIKAFFWKWRRSHQPRTQHSLQRVSQNVVAEQTKTMRFIGVFGRTVADEMEGVADHEDMANGLQTEDRQTLGRGAMRAMAAAPGLAEQQLRKNDGFGAGQPATVEPTVRTKFADTALWVAAVTTGPDGTATVDLTMPENLTTWMTRVWAMGDGARCGQGTAEVVTTKDLIVRLQAPRFFVEKDEVVISANVHNYLENAKDVRVELGMEGDCLELVEGFASSKDVRVDANGETRVDWRVKVTQSGAATITVKALTDEESDAMQMAFPVLVHGMLKTESFSGALRPGENRGLLTVTVPAERKPEQTRLEVRYSPSVALAMVDALPYLVDYPYDSTDTTLNRFLPAVLTQKVLLDMGLDLEAIREKRANLNPQELGDDAERAAQWKRYDRNPVFDRELLDDMVKAGVNRLASLQVSDGGWGWFGGRGARSYAHTTAVIVHGLQMAQENGVALIPGVLERGLEWLKRHQAEQLELLKNALIEDREEGLRWKSAADNLDAFVYMVLVDAGHEDKEMREFLYRDRNDLSVYAKAMFGLALHKVGDVEKRDMIVRNIEQFLVQDDENQTAYLRLPESNVWWAWHGGEYEAHAYYLKLLCVTRPDSETAARLVKYLINNRKHASYWESTRDTAICVEAMAQFVRASGEAKPDMTVIVMLDGRELKRVAITVDNLFSFDNKLVLTGDAVATGKHVVELVREGQGPLYYNAYLTNFTLENPIASAGLEIKVQRKFYQLVPVEKTVKVEGARGQALDQRVQKYERILIPGPFDLGADVAGVQSGDLIEVELEIESKNDYEYLLFEDMKPAGCEPVEVRSGYTRNDLGAYVEFRDERTVFFVRRLARGKHSVSYRLFAQIPGRFSALPVKASGMYAPELAANSNEHTLAIRE